MRMIGRGRYAWGTYPSSSNAAANALTNRNVAAMPSLLTVPFTPGLFGSASLIAATVFTPRVSGVIQVTASISLINGATPETYGLNGTIFNGTNLTVSGGEGSSDGWFFGSNTPPVVGGSGIVLAQFLGAPVLALGANEQGTLTISNAISQPLPLGVPVAIEIALAELGGGNPIAGPLSFFALSVLELP